MQYGSTPFTATNTKIMTYKQFKKLESALFTYFTKAKNCGYDALRNDVEIVKLKLASDFYDARIIAYKYRLYRQRKYKLQKLVYHIIILKFGENEVFENALRNRVRLKSIVTHHNNIDDSIEALIKFMNCKNVSTKHTRMRGDP